MLNEGTKYDSGKTRHDLLSGYALDEIGKVATFGATKYADHNWRKGIKYSRLFSAGLRHLWAFWRGQDLDPETGLSHLAHAGWCCMALLEHTQTRKDYDDRFVEEAVRPGGGITAAIPWTSPQKPVTLGTTVPGLPGNGYINPGNTWDSRSLISSLSQADGYQSELVWDEVPGPPHS